MSTRLIRVAIYAFPGEWRRRYGSELEQMSIDLLTDRPGTAQHARVLLGLVSGGIRKRARTLRVTRRVILVAVPTALVAITVASAITRPSQSPLRSDQIYGFHVVGTPPRVSTPVNVGNQPMSVTAVTRTRRSVKIGSQEIKMTALTVKTRKDGGR